MRIQLSASITILVVALLGPGCSHPTLGQKQTSAQSSATDPNEIQFVRSVALTYAWQPPDHSPETILETIGCGCAFLDYNQDGNLDILLIGPKLALYEGDGHGHFKDVTTAVGLSGFRGHFIGCAVGDYDNDGYPDIYVTGYQTGLLLHNVNGKRFEDVSHASHIPPQPWGTSASFADIDGDGKLDLFVANYVRFDSASKQFCDTNGIKTGCPPGTYDGVPGRLYRNLGGGKFEDITKSWGLSSTSGKTLGVTFADFDHSGRQSLALANDEVPGELWLNTGKAFQNIGPEAGTAYSNVGQPHAGMGEDWGDYDGDGNLDLAVMTFSTELKPIFHNEGHHFFADRSSQLGLTAPLTPYVAFGVKWFDANNDGWLDLMMTNGHTSDNIGVTGQGLSFREPTVFLKNNGGTRFEQIHMPDLDKQIVGRGLAIGDFDNDGLVDALVVDGEGQPLVLHNETPHPGHWLEVRLIGRSGNRDGYGAALTLETAERHLVRYCHADGSYLSSSDPRVHFGIGSETAIKRLSISWPGGKVQHIDAPVVDRVITVEEGKSPK